MHAHVRSHAHEPRRPLQLRARACNVAVSRRQHAMPLESAAPRTPAGCGSGRDVAGGTAARHCRAHVMAPTSSARQAVGKHGGQGSSACTWGNSGAAAVAAAANVRSCAVSAPTQLRLHAWADCLRAERCGALQHALSMQEVRAHGNQHMHAWTNAGNVHVTPRINSRRVCIVSTAPGALICSVLALAARLPTGTRCCGACHRQRPAASSKPLQRGWRSGVVPPCTIKPRAAGAN